MEEKTYIFTRKVEGTEWGVVKATSEEEAIQKIMENDFEDIIDNDVEFTNKQEDIVELREDY